MKTKSLFILFSLFLATLSSFAQKSEEQAQKGQIGITFSSFGNNDVIRFHELIGAASYNGDNFHTVGINYIYKLNSTLDIETGLEFCNHKILIKPNLPPDMNRSPYGAKFSLINLPLTLSVNFLKYIFLNGGLNLDFDVSKSSPIDRQTGIGAILGFGFKYNFKCGASAFVNPYVKAHSLIPFSSDNNHQRVMENGVRFGLMYTLK